MAVFFKVGFGLIFLSYFGIVFFVLRVCSSVWLERFVDIEEASRSSRLRPTGIDFLSKIWYIRHNLRACSSSATAEVRARPPRRVMTRFAVRFYKIKFTGV